MSNIKSPARRLHQTSNSHLLRLFGPEHANQWGTEMTFLHSANRKRVRGTASERPVGAVELHHFEPHFDSQQINRPSHLARKPRNGNSAAGVRRHLWQGLADSRVSSRRAHGVNNAFKVRTLSVLKQLSYVYAWVMNKQRLWCMIHEKIEFWNSGYNYFYLDTRIPVSGFRLEFRNPLSPPPYY